MKKRSLIAGATALVCATIAAVVVAAPNDRPGNGGAPRGNDDENWPASCAGPTLVDKVLCPSSINYNETTSAPGWSPNTEVKSAPFAGYEMGPNAKLQCNYTADGTDKLTIHKTSPKACVAAKKFGGFNCCK
ncbi:MAG: hypothetical protein U0270_20585 [Labilithrix sp.]